MITYILIGLVTIFILSLLVSVIFSNPERTKNKIEEYENKMPGLAYQKDLSAFNIEAQDKFRNLNDSLKLISSTKEIDTLLSRIIDIDGVLIWINDNDKKGMPVLNLIKNYDIADMGHMYLIIYEEINNDILRVAEMELDKWSKIKRRKGAMFDYSTSKLFGNLERLEKSLKNTINKETVSSQIKYIWNLVEDEYSNCNN